MRYTFDDDDNFLSDDTSVRRSGRNSERDTPSEVGPITTLSGRQVKPRRGGEYGASLLSGQIDEGDTALDTEDHDATDASDVPRSRSTRMAGRAANNGINVNGKRRHVDDYDPDDEMSEEEDAAPSGEEWDSEANEHDDEEMPDASDEDDNIDDEELDDLDDGILKSLVVKLKVPTTQASVADRNNKASASLEGPRGDVKQEESAWRPMYDSPSQLNPPAAQLPLSGYPTPASLPPAIPKPEHAVQTTTSQPLWQQEGRHGEDVQGQQTTIKHDLHHVSAATNAVN